MTNTDTALLTIGRHLQELQYQFTTITPESHRRVLARSSAQTINNENMVLRALFGWSAEVRTDLIPRDILQALEKAECLLRQGEFTKSSVRFSSLGELLFLHSSYPTTERNSVFFGPDTYRFVRFLKEHVAQAERVVDIGCGCGVGGLSLTSFLAKAGTAPEEVILSDIDEQALRFTAINVELNKFKSATLVKSNLFDAIDAGADTVIANPPFIMDDKHRTYRHGGDDYGSDITLKIIEQALRYGAKQTLVYTGACVVNGEDQVRSKLEARLGRDHFTYEELDPGIFGEELSNELYRDVDRIAAVGIVIKR